MRAVARSSNHGEWALKRFHPASLHTTVDRTMRSTDRELRTSIHQHPIQLLVITSAFKIISLSLSSCSR
jgi:hypothetical protein